MQSVRVIGMNQKNGQNMKQSRIKDIDKLIGPVFTHEELRGALFHVQDTLERCLVPFFVLGNTAKHIINDEEPLTGDSEVHVGVRKEELTREAMMTLKTLIPELSISEYQISYSYNNVPVVIDVIHRDYKFFEYPDRKFYFISEFLLPNPFEKYWSVRNLIK